MADQRTQERPVDLRGDSSVGGSHNTAWQNCTGDVYDAPIAAEHATHSMEHGAVWITHRPDLPAEQVQRLAERVRGVDYMMLSLTTRSTRRSRCRRGIPPHRHLRRR
ncbi:DUF3105 domain-containing protein [Micromonospora sp. M12]